MRPSVIGRLPPAVRSELKRRIRAAGYGNSHAIAKWLTEKGYPVSHSPVGAYAKRLKEIDCPEFGMSPEKIRAAIALSTALEQFISAFITIGNAAPATPEPTDRMETE